MRDFVKVSQTVWKSKKFRNLPDDDSRFMYLYILTCPHSNSAGCFDLPPSYAAADMRWEEDRVLAALNNLSEAALIRFDRRENTVMVENWFEFNSPANPKHAVGMLSQLRQASSDDLKRDCGELIRAEIKRKQFDRETFVRNALNSFFEPLGNGIVTETKTRLDQTETETREESSRPPLRAVAAPKGDGLAASAERLMKTSIMRRAV